MVDAYKAVLFAPGFFAGLEEGRLDVSTVQLHLVIQQRLVKLPQESNTHWNEERKITGR